MEKGSRMRQTSRQKLYGCKAVNGHLKPIYSPPASLLDPVSDRIPLAMRPAVARQPALGKLMTAGALPFM